MNTQCPHCQTIFDIDQQQLQQADGQVRCGHCLAIFTATEHEVNEQDDLYNDLIEEIQVNENESTSTPLPDVIPPDLRAETRSKKRHYGFLGSLFWSLAILTMICTGILQYAYYERVRLTQYNELRPWLGLLCQYAQCELPEPRDPSRIELNNKNIFSHPNTENALMISATIINQAAFEQNFPMLQLKFENIRGKTIAGRQFTPEEYLGIGEDKISKMIPGTPVSISVEIIDPGKEMVSYTFEFL